MYFLVQCPRSITSLEIPKSMHFIAGIEPLSSDDIINCGPHPHPHLKQSPRVLSLKFNISISLKRFSSKANGRGRAGD